MKQYVSTKICGALVALAILGIGGVAEADFVIFTTGRSGVREVEVEKYFDAGNYIEYRYIAGVSVKVPKSQVLAILDRGTGDLQVLNPDLFTPEQLNRIRQVSETYRRRLETARKAEEEARKAQEARRKEQEEINKERLLQTQEAIEKAKAEERARREALGRQLRSEMRRVYACAFREAGGYRQFKRLSAVNSIILIKRCRKKLFPN